MYIIDSWSRKMYTRPLNGMKNTNSTGIPRDITTGIVRNAYGPYMNGGYHPKYYNPTAQTPHPDMDEYTPRYFDSPDTDSDDNNSYISMSNGDEAQLYIDPTGMVIITSNNPELRQQIVAMLQQMGGV